jgi:8-oxo-dGTP pyrophosphatase MutT (NUDIX family)
VEPGPEPLLCVGALISDGNGRFFVQRRAPDRRLLPNTWDIVGGHVEPGETLDEALRREVYEETGWTVTRVLDTIAQYRWRGNDGLERLETDFHVAVEGDLGRPRLEAGKHTEYRWLGPTEVDLLMENRDPGDDLLRTIVERAFATLR